jgi:hypothetical protein
MQKIKEGFLLGVGFVIVWAAYQLVSAVIGFGLSSMMSVFMMGLRGG